MEAITQYLLELIKFTICASLNQLLRIPSKSFPIT